MIDTRSQYPSKHQYKDVGTFRVSNKSKHKSWLPLLAMYQIYWSLGQHHIEVFHSGYTYGDRDWPISIVDISNKK